MTELEDRTIFASCLDAGERILWQGKPGKGHLFTIMDIYRVPFSIVWCVGALLGTTIVFLGNGPVGAKLICLLLSVVGLAMVFLPFQLKAYRRQKTFYAITDRKILWKCGDTIEILDRTNMPAVYVRKFRDGNGLILFGQEWNYYRHSCRFVCPAPGLWALENIPDVMNVYRML